MTRSHHRRAAMKRKQTLRERGEGSLPGMTKEELQKRIDMVVAKAARSEDATDLCTDVVRDIRFSHFGIRRVRVHRLG